MSFLKKIIAVKEEEVARLRNGMSLPELRERAIGMPAGRNFRGAIAAGTCTVIAEVKKHSPSLGSLREDLDPCETASLYEKNGAAAISVLTDRSFFHGAPEYLTEIGKTVKIPVLRKDFIIDVHQIYESKLLGADAVLLIARLFTGKKLRQFVDLALSLAICPLVEVHGTEDLGIALNAGAEVIGINNRDLKTFATDIGNTLRLVPHIPPDKIVISESAIRTREDIIRLTGAGVRAFLIGEALVSAADPGQKLREFRGVIGDQL